jgi:hypothetical protein
MQCQIILYRLFLKAAPRPDSARLCGQFERRKELKPSTAAGITATTSGSGGYEGAAAHSLEGEDQAPSEHHLNQYTSL